MTCTNQTDVSEYPWSCWGKLTFSQSFVSEYQIFSFKNGHLGAVFLGHYLFCIANREEKKKQFIIYYGNNKWFLVLVSYISLLGFLVFYSKSRK